MLSKYIRLPHIPTFDRPLPFHHIYRDNMVDLYKLYKVSETTFNNTKKAIAIKNVLKEKGLCKVNTIKLSNNNTKIINTYQNTIQIILLSIINANNMLDIMDYKHNLENNKLEFSLFNFSNIFPNKFYGAYTNKIYNNVVMQYNLIDILAWLNGSNEIEAHIFDYYKEKKINCDIHIIIRTIKSAHNLGWDNFLKTHRNNILNEYQLLNNDFKNLTYNEFINNFNFNVNKIKENFYYPQ